ncbi:hypothetical protein BJ742DRAFT_806657 [Cladochytrium replicatum]|nr:hypothetical protein BJ742DRAFT_806657 [Cladochytrium replicatum]
MQQVCIRTPARADFMAGMDDSSSPRSQKKSSGRPTQLHPSTVVPVTLSITTYAHMSPNSDEYAVGKRIAVTRELQYSIHSPGRFLLRELFHVFSNVSHPAVREAFCRFSGGSKAGESGSDGHNFFVVPLFWKSTCDLVAVTGESNYERDILLECCFEFATRVKQLLSSDNKNGQEPRCWVDFTDPASGYPVWSPRGASLYPDVDGGVRLMKYNTVLAGCCKILQHPLWGTKNYPGTLFVAGASVEQLATALKFAATVAEWPSGIEIVPSL